MIDLSFLKKFTKEDPKKMKRYITLYLDVAPKTFEEMKTNLQNEEWEKMRIHAHSLKPQTDFMGIARLKNYLVEIENAVKDKNYSIIPTTFEKANLLNVESTHLLREYINVN